ncbi:hypothetical protein VKT23_004729 [Stygiomarasmius scandens]|uniref:DUF6532 domain-containing protein n=1 Tax=Marasmiellus scandens TaxID=2682957 RepID=A0ABR1JZ74_9AGAR
MFMTGAERARDLRDSAASVVETAFKLGLDDRPSTSELEEIVLKRYFMYGLAPDGAFDMRKPFQHPVYPRYLRTTMFGSNIYSRQIISKNWQTIFRSSDPSKPHELEVTKGMLCMATAAICSILQRASSGRSSNFPSHDHPSVWQGALRVLENLEKVNPPVYHILMHDLYVQSSGATGASRHGLTTQQVFDSVDWASLATAKVDPVTRKIITESES